MQNNNPRPPRPTKELLEQFQSIAKSHDLEVVLVDDETLKVTHTLTGQSFLRPISDVELEFEPSPKK